ncbi:MAG: SAM-dependent methyltransferase [Candidatus Tumulicola sp.]
MSRRIGSLSAVGIGIRAPAQVTLEASSRIEWADKVFTIVTDPLAQYWVQGLNGNTESLVGYYVAGKERCETYHEMVERIVASVRENLRVCVVSYGHPGIVAYPLHEAVRRVRDEGFPAEMLAGVSAEDCLFAELGVDPATAGWRSYEATDFLVYHRGADPASNLVLWQIGGIAISKHMREADAWNREGLVVLTEALLETYRPEHEVVVYEAARLPLCKSAIERVVLERLPYAGVRALSTLYVPPMTNPTVDERMMCRLGISLPTKAPPAEFE